MPIYGNPWQAPPPPQNGIHPAPEVIGPGGTGSLWEQFYTDNPNAYYERYLRQQGGQSASPYTNYGAWARGQYGQLQDQYKASLGDKSIGYSWVDFLNENGGQLRQNFAGLGPRGRGERPPSMRARWSGF